MNPVTFNDSLPNATEIASAIGMPLSVFNAPIFTTKGAASETMLKGPLGDGNNSVFNHEIENNPNAFPFREFRLEILDAEPERTHTVSEKYWIFHHNGVLGFVVQPIVLKSNDALVRFSKTKHGFFFRSEGFRNGLMTGKGGYFDVSGVQTLQFLELHNPELFRLCHRDMPARFTALAFFRHEAMSGANFIAAVRPNKIGKSVQWLTARTHYVLIHKSHPANSKELQRGQAVMEDERYLRRQAHSRRAHVRILRSSRFKEQGRKINVRACWVGPKEWKQGSSIYVLKA